MQHAAVRRLVVRTHIELIADFDVREAVFHAVHQRHDRRMHRIRCAQILQQNVFPFRRHTMTQLQNQPMPVIRDADADVINLGQLLALVFAVENHRIGVHRGSKRVVKHPRSFLREEL